MKKTKTSPRKPPGKVNVAVVGLGFMGSVHTRAWLQIPSVRVVALCGQSRLPKGGLLPGISGNISATEPIELGDKVKVYRDLNQLLANPRVDLVDLCTPTALHPAQSIAALNAGKHVLCEKPIGRTMAAAAEIAAVARAAQGFFMPAMCLRFWPGWALLKKIVSEKVYGKVLAARFRRVSEKPTWSRTTYGHGMDPGGALFDLHIHDTDFVQFLFGRPAGVSSTGVTRAGSIDHIVTQYHFPNGPVVYAEGSWLLTKGFRMAYTVHCERATFDYDSDRGAKALRLSEPAWPVRALKIEGDGYIEELRYFVDCIQNNKRPEVVTVDDAVSALEICEAEELSVRTGKLVELKEPVPVSQTPDSSEAMDV